MRKTTDSNDDVMREYRHLSGQIRQVAKGTTAAAELLCNKQSVTVEGLNEQLLEALEVHHQALKAATDRYGRVLQSLKRAREAAKNQADLFGGS